MGNDFEVVSDVQDGDAELALQVSHHSRIWAWVVTSNAVVGSSAIRRLGWQHSATAMSARRR